MRVKREGNEEEVLPTTVINDQQPVSPHGLTLPLPSQISNLIPLLFIYLLFICHHLTYPGFPVDRRASQCEPQSTPCQLTLALALYNTHTTGSPSLLTLRRLRRRRLRTRSAVPRPPPFIPSSRSCFCGLLGWVRGWSEWVVALPFSRPTN